MFTRRRTELHIHHHFDDEQIGRMAWLIKEELRKIMATGQEILAKVTANTDVLRSVAIAVDGLNGEHESISAAIDDLKKQIADGQTPDFSELEAKVAEQGTVIDGLKTAIGANTTV